MTDSITCPYCKETINANAVKCRHCHEFMPGAITAKDKDNKNSLITEGFSLASKSFLPIAVIVLVFAYKPTIEGLLNRTTQAEMFGTKLVFGQNKAFKGKLSPTELYFLIGSARRYGHPFEGGLNIDSLEKDGNISVIYSLQNKELLEFKILDNTPDLIASGYGKKCISPRPTDKGKDFLIELGLKFDGKLFVGAP